MSKYRVEELVKSTTAHYVWWRTLYVANDLNEVDAYFTELTLRPRKSRRRVIRLVDDANTLLRQDSFPHAK